MNIYLLSMYEDPMGGQLTDRLMAMKSAPFPHFSVLGTWSPQMAECFRACASHNERLVEPLVVRWEQSIDVVGDFSWDGPFGYVFILKDNVADFMQGFGARFDLLNVEVLPRTTNSTRANCIPKPYRGPRLRWCRCRQLLDLDKTASNVVVKSCCSVCGALRHTFRYQGIVIRRKDWRGEHMFRIRTNGESLATFVTEKLRHAIQDARFSNVSFTKAGEIVE
jgi:hypothetical protein